MENNQEHKIDKIFRETFENQEFAPPTDAWMGIHTYTIGQEEKKPKVWLKYASLVMVMLVFLGLGVWYFVDNQVFIDKDIPKLQSQEVLSGDTDTSVRNGETLSSPMVSLTTSPLMRKQILPITSISSYSIIQEETPMLLSHGLLVENTNNGGKEETPMLLSHELLVENTNNSGKIESITSKPLILNDLSEKILKESERKIVALDEKNAHKKEVYKSDSVVYGKGFSLKHPIINFRLGLYNNSVNINAKEGGINPFNSNVFNPNNIYGFSGIIGIAWKLNNKSRISLNTKFVNYSAINPQSKSAAAYVDPLSPANKPTGTFEYNSSKDVYEYLTPFGYVTQPIDPKSSATPKDFDVRFLGRITNLQIGLNYEYDLIAFRHKKGGIPAMEIYGLVGMNVQKIRKYTGFYFLFKNSDPNDPKNNTYQTNNISNISQTELSSGSPIVLGYNTGLGIRFQLSKRFGLNILGNYEANINSWVKDLPFTTRLSVLSVESGFFVNL